MTFAPTLKMRNRSWALHVSLSGQDCSRSQWCLGDVEKPLTVSMKGRDTCQGSQPRFLVCAEEQDSHQCSEAAWLAPRAGPNLLPFF